MTNDAPDRPKLASEKRPVAELLLSPLDLSAHSIAEFVKLVGETVPIITRDHSRFGTVIIVIIVIALMALAATPAT